MSDLLIWQYRGKPKARATISAIQFETDRAFLSAVEFGQMLNIDTATGFALDLVGRHVGVTRLIKQYIAKNFFGFQGDANAQGFDMGQWYVFGDQTRDSALLDDEDFRFIIKARIFKNYQTGALGDVVDSIRYLFGNTANVVDNYDMTMNAIIPFGLINEFKAYAVKNLDILVRPVGVRLRFFEVSNHSFGWHEDPSAFGFDNGFWSDFV